PLIALAETEFSHEVGFHDEPFELILSHKDPEAAIFYTLDGSVSDPSNLGGFTYQYKDEYARPPAPVKGKLLTREYRTYKYQSPIQIRDRKYEPDQLALISTTFDEVQYFPTPVPKDDWLNTAIWYVNRLVRGIHRSVNIVIRGYVKLA